MKFPRNHPCPCKGGLKFKNCHADIIPKIISKDDVIQYREMIKQGDIVFLTHINMDKIIKLAEKKWEPWTKKKERV